MTRYNFVAVDGVIVEGQTLAGLACGAGERIRKAVQRPLIGGENERVIQQRWIFRRATCHFALFPLPQLD